MLAALIVLPLLFAAVIVLGTVPFHEVARSRVANFARRQSLPITVANGPIVIRYLATTRRWRGCGLLVTVVGGVLEAWLLHGNLRIGTTALFVGWFVGAVLAEWRVSVQSTESAKRTALLVPRRLSDYVAGYLLWPIGVAFGLLVALEAVALPLTSHHTALVGWLALTLGSGVAIALVARHVLTRAQPRAAVDVLAADESIRSRSLHVLAGSTLAIVGYLAAVVVALADGRTGVGHALSAVFGLGLPVLGVLVALRTSKLPTRAFATPELTTR